MPKFDHVVVDSADPFERGRQRGAQVRDALTWTWPLYKRLFELTAHDAGRPYVDVGAVATSCREAVADWSPDVLRELDGVAAGAGLDAGTVMALNARTEVFARARGDGPTECSTLVALHGRAGTAVGAQTWDWHDELSHGWHVQTVRGNRHTFVGLAEFGMLAKIGVNDAGVGVLFNLLRHASDGGRPLAASHDAAAPDVPIGRAGADGAVPVHLVAHEVLARASTLDEAVSIARSAPVIGSTVLTVLTADGALSVELSPAGAGCISPAEGWLVHTNHFLDPLLASGERVAQDITTTFERAALLRVRARQAQLPIDVESLVALLDAHEGDGAAVCRHPPPDASTGYRTATLATVGIDPARRTARVSAHGPCRRAEIVELTASR